VTRFHGYFRSSAAYRCRIALNLKGVATEFVPVHLRRGGGEQKTTAYRAVNPQALVPALEVDGLVLTQSLAIVEWLDETWPEPPLLPANKDLRARVRAFAQVIACDIHPLQNLRVLDYLKNELGQDQAAADVWCRRWIGDGLAACERLLARETATGPFAFGAAPGLGDICLIPQLFSADRFGVDLADMPRLRAVRAECEALPAFAAAHPSRQPDSEA
jgi:maleylacetoacetate isomerase